MTMEKAGQRTIRVGLQRIGDALRDPRVFAVLVGVPAAILVIDLGLNVGLRHWLGRGASGTWYGFELGAGVTGAFLILLFVVVVLAGGVNWITGGLAERETGKVFGDLGPEWRVAHHLAFTLGKPPRTWPVDVDHVAVGPYGLLVVETKWSSALLLPERLSPGHRDIRQAERNAALIRELLEEDSVEATIVPVLVYWGRAKLPVDPVVRVGDVRIVYGVDSGRWLPLLAGHRLSSEAQDAAWSVIAKHAAGGLASRLVG